MWHPESESGQLSVGLTKTHPTGVPPGHSRKLQQVFQQLFPKTNVLGPTGSVKKHHCEKAVVVCWKCHRHLSLVLVSSICEVPQETNKNDPVVIPFQTNKGMNNTPGAQDLFHYLRPLGVKGLRIPGLGLLG